VLVYLGNILRRERFEVIAAASGQEAIELARKLCPNLIILDMLIPDISGASVATILSEGEPAARIPILFLTGMIDKQEETLIKKQTAARYLAVIW
jgi:CheY-like chemotaxis protein